MKEPTKIEVVPLTTADRGLFRFGKGTSRWMDVHRQIEGLIKRVAPDAQHSDMMRITLESEEAQKACEDSIRSYMITRHREWIGRCRKISDNERFVVVCVLERRQQAL